MSEHLERPNMNKPVFGDFVVLEMQRHRVANEYYVHEVLSQQFYSNYWRDVPIVSSQKETLHKTTEAVISVSNSFGLPIFNVRVCDILPMVGDKWCWKESPLRTRIAELEERLELCESALTSMVYQFFYSSESGALVHGFMSAEEETAKYLVDYGIARWANEHKNSIVFEEVQE